MFKYQEVEVIFEVRMFSKLYCCRTAAFLMLTLLVFAVVPLAFGLRLGLAESVVIVVPDDYVTIQAAVNAAATGDTIFVRSGVYVENVLVRKAVRLIGEDRDTTIVDGWGSTVFYVAADGATVSGFTIQNASDRWQDGVHLEGLEGACHCSIINCNIIGNYEAVEVAHRADGNWIIGNRITDNYAGIGLDESSDNVIYGNNVTENGAGILVYSYSANNTIIGNNVSSNTLYGISLQRTLGCVVAKNNIANNVIGSVLYSNDGSYIIGNNFTENSDGGIVLCVISEGNTIYHNNFINNKKYQAYELDYCNNSWNDGYPSGGNYWSDYTGIDNYSGPYQNKTGSDEIGDTPYIVNSNNVDHYPLISPYTPLHDIAITNIASSKTVVGQGYCTNINITIANQGNTSETIIFTTYANKTIIQTNIITLTNNTSTTITFTWNTTDFAYGNYTIWAHALPILGELNKTDNTLTDGTILVTIAGDVNGNCLCDIQDISILVDKFLAAPPNPLYDPNCDVNEDLIIDMADVSIAIDHFLQEYTP
jgi:parallel beta-helix repeat protein